LVETSGEDIAATENILRLVQAINYLISKVKKDMAKEAPTI
jgi:hypothetical protein